jgi:hypothetical protein
MSFNKIVKEILGSILSLCEFTLNNESRGVIEYEHKLLLISITYDFARSFELDVNFYFKANNQSYSLAELKEYFDKKKNRFIATQILEDDKLKAWVVEVKMFLENHLYELIKDHVVICFELDSMRKQKTNFYNNERDERFFKEDVEKLWNNKDYVRLIKLVQNYKGNIDDISKKKYEYAIKKVS